MRTFHDPAGGSLLAIPLGVLLAFGALLVSGCSAKEDAYDSPEETTTATEAPASLNYVALGDSLAVGLWADRGYVDRYTNYLKTFGVSYPLQMWAEGAHAL